MEGLSVIYTKRYLQVAWCYGTRYGFRWIRTIVTFIKVLGLTHPAEGCSLAGYRKDDDHTHTQTLFDIPIPICQSKLRKLQQGIQSCGLQHQLRMCTFKSSFPKRNSWFEPKTYFSCGLRCFSQVFGTQDVSVATCAGILALHAPFRNSERQVWVCDKNRINQKFTFKFGRFRSSPRKIRILCVTTLDCISLKEMLWTCCIVVLGCVMWAWQSNIIPWIL